MKTVQVYHPNMRFINTKTFWFRNSILLHLIRCLRMPPNSFIKTRSRILSRILTPSWYSIHTLSICFCNATFISTIMLQFEFSFWCLRQNQWPYSKIIFDTLMWVTIPLIKVAKLRNQSQNISKHTRDNALADGAHSRYS